MIEREAPYKKLCYGSQRTQNSLSIKACRAFHLSRRIYLNITNLVERIVSAKRQIIFAILGLFLSFSVYSHEAKAAISAPELSAREARTVMIVDQIGGVRVIDTSLDTSRSSQTAFVGVPEKLEARRQELLERSRYSFSKLVSASLPRKLAALAIASFVLVLIGGSLFVLTGKTDSWKDAMFQAYTLLNNVPGGSAVDENRPLHLVAANALFVVGVLSFAVVLGVVSGSMQEELEAAMHGSGRVAERGHILLLNSNQKTVPVVRMIDRACKDGMPSLPIVILTRGHKASHYNVYFLGKLSMPPLQPARACSWSACLDLKLRCGVLGQEDLDQELRKALRHPAVEASITKT